MRRTLLSVLLWWLVLARLAAAGPAAIAVVYPNLPEPYHGVFADIVSGIQSGATLEVKEYLVSSDGHAAALPEWLAKGNYGALIVLGQRTLETVQALGLKIPIIAGAVKIAPEQNPTVTAISLMAAPDRVFDLVRTYTPQTKKVHVVYNPVRQGWLIALAKQAAAERGLTLVGHEAPDLRSTAQRYSELFDSPGPGNALWLPSEDNAGQEALLAEVLEQLWRRGWPGFSSNPGLVKRGMLFALYPDNHAMGVSLAKLAAQRIADAKATPAVFPVTDLLTAVNLRTADHLNIQFSAGQRQGFELVFPEP